MFKTGIISVVMATAILVYPAQARTKTLTPEAEAAILEALDDEYKAEATYTAIVEEFGADNPLSNIIEAERMHSSRLVDLLEKYGVEVPENGYLDGSLPTPALPDTLTEAYVMGIQGEIDNLELYENNLLPAVSDYKDVTRVFTALMNASQTKHLVAFERCADGRCGSSRDTADSTSRSVDTTAKRGGSGERAGAMGDGDGQRGDNGAGNAGRGSGAQGQGNGRGSRGG